MENSRTSIKYFFVSRLAFLFVFDSRRAEPILHSDQEATRVSGSRSSLLVAASG